MVDLPCVGAVYIRLSLLLTRAGGAAANAAARAGFLAFTAWHDA
jgi:hypothetical protein